MVQAEKNKITIKETPEHRELQKINNKVFKEMFQNELDSALESLYEEVLDEKFEDLEKRIRAVRREFKDVNNLLMELQDWIILQNKPMLSSIDAFKQKHTNDILELSENIADLDSAMLNYSRESKSLLIEKIENITKEQQHSTNELKNLEKEIKIQISTLSQNVNKVSELQDNTFNNFMNLHKKSISNVNNNLESVTKNLSNTITKEHKKTSDNTLNLVTEKNIEIEKRILNIEDSIKNNFEIIQREDGLTQLTNYKKENNLQISSLKSAIVWLMGINIVLAISILTVLIIVLF